MNTNLLSAVAAAATIATNTVSFDWWLSPQKPIYEEPPPTVQGTNGEIRSTKVIYHDPCFAATLPPCPGHDRIEFRKWLWNGKGWEQEQLFPTNAVVINRTPITEGAWTNRALVSWYTNVYEGGLFGTNRASALFAPTLTINGVRLYFRADGTWSAEYKDTKVELTQEGAVIK